MIENTLPSDSRYLGEHLQNRCLGDLDVLLEARTVTTEVFFPEQ